MAIPFAALFVIGMRRWKRIAAIIGPPKRLGNGREIGGEGGTNLKKIAELHELSILADRLCGSGQVVGVEQCQKSPGKGIIEGILKLQPLTAPCIKHRLCLDEKLKTMRVLTA
jgi:hypothetical protein